MHLNIVKLFSEEKHVTFAILSPLTENLLFRDIASAHVQKALLL
jgi:hypothetical protein